MFFTLIAAQAISWCDLPVEVRTECRASYSRLRPRPAHCPPPSAATACPLRPICESVPTDRVRETFARLSEPYPEGQRTLQQIGPEEYLVCIEPPFDE